MMISGTRESNYWTIDRGSDSERTMLEGRKIVREGGGSFSHLLHLVELRDSRRTIRRSPYQHNNDYKG